ncbi:MAG: hypothetical protein AABX75_00845 [Nanoarchaeota archaeon]
MATIRILNIVLAITALALFVNLMGGSKLTGDVIYSLDKSEPKCLVSYGDEQSSIEDLNQCCFMLQAQLACSPYGINSADFACSTSDMGLKYIANQKTISYCKAEGYRIKFK